MKTLRWLLCACLLTPLSGCLFFYVKTEPAEPAAPTAAAVGIDERKARQIEAAHPNWMRTVMSKEFSVWKSLQPYHVQQLSASDRPEDAIRMLDLFKADRAKWQ